MIYVDSEGHQKHVKDADAKLVERERKGVHVGKTMRCITGTHAGLLCEVLALEPKVSSSSDHFLHMPQQSYAGTIPQRVVMHSQCKSVFE